MTAGLATAVLAIDQGTTGTKVLVVNENLEVLAEHSTPFQQHFPQPGWVEHDLNDIWASAIKGIEAVLKKVNVKSITTIGITNQRETVGFWSRKTGEPLSKAIVWQDRRTTDRCTKLKQQGNEALVQNKTGLLLDPYFSGTKISWALDHWPAVQNAAKSNDLAIGTIDTFLLWKLTGGYSFATEASNASRTLLFGLKSLAWDKELLSLLKVPESALPEVKTSFSIFGKTKGVPGLPDGIPISGMIGDQQSALLGQACINPGQAKCTYGTGAFILLNTGSEIKFSKHRLLTTVAWTNSKNEATYAIEGSAFMAGATIQWLRDGLGMIQNSQEIETLARSVASSDGVVLVPAFTGLGAPYWDPEARATITGLTRGTTRAHLARAALEGIALQNTDILNAMEQDLGSPLVQLNVDGGACKNNLLMQMQADFLNRKLYRPKMTETTSLGAVFASGLGAGVWSDIKDIKNSWKLDQEFSPVISGFDREQKLHEWKNAIRRTLTNTSSHIN